MAQYKSLGQTYLRMAIRYPLQYQMANSLRYVDISASENLSRYHHAMRDLMRRLLARAQESGQIAPGTDTDLIAMCGRAYVFGLATMVVEGRMDTWYDRTDPERSALVALEDFVNRLATTAATDIRRSRDCHQTVL